MIEESGTVPQNVSHRLQQRHHAAALLIDLLAAGDQEPIEQLNRELLGLGRELLAVVPRFLETSDTRSIARLGALLAGYPDRPAAAQALRAVVLRVSCSDQSRIAAMVILEHYLGQLLGHEFMAGLHNPNRIAAETLLKLLERIRGDRNLLLGYLAVLEEQNPGALPAVLAAVKQLDGDQKLQVLPLLAQHESPEVAAGALAILLELRTTPALLALRMLGFVLPRPQNDRLQRALLKMTLSGHELPDFAAPSRELRALQTPIDGRGGSAIWFIVPCPDGSVQLLSLLLSDVIGVREAFGGDSFAADSFPERQAPGSIYHSLDSPLLARESEGALPANLLLQAAGRGSLLREPQHEDPAAASDAGLSPIDFMEVDFDYARAQVLEFQKLNWQRGYPLPLEYRLLHDIIWRFGPPRCPAVRLPRPAPASRTLDLSLLFNAAPFRSWYLQGSAVREVARQLLEQYSRDELDAASPGAALRGEQHSAGADRAVLRAAAALAAGFFTPATVRLVVRRIERSAEWLTIARADDSAALARLAAHQLATQPPASSYFALLLARRGLARALQSLSPPE